MSPPEERSGNPLSTNPNSDRVLYQKNLLGVYEVQIKLHLLQYLTFVLMGLAILWPWNCFLSASEYYHTRFEELNGDLYARIYSSTMMSVSTIAQLIYNYYLSQKQIDADYYKRFIVGQLFTFFIFLIMAISCVAFLNIPALVFFVFLMSMILFSSLSCCSSQNGAMAIVNIFGPHYAQGLMVGQAIAGVLPTISLIVSIYMVGEKQIQIEEVEKNYGVMSYYLTSTFVSTIALFCFLSFIYAYAMDRKLNTEYTTLNQNENDMQIESNFIQLVDESGDVSSGLIDNSLNEETSNASCAEIFKEEKVSFIYLFGKLKFIVGTIVVVFIVSLIFPVFASNIISVNKQSHDDGIIHFTDNKIFIPMAFLFWNVGDLAGRIICGYPIFQMQNEKLMFFFSMVRIIFIPVLLMCNLQKESEIEPLINSDLAYIFIQFMYGLTNGHLISNSFMNIGPRFDKDSEKKAAGGFTGVFLSIGLAVGSVCSYLFISLVS